MKLRYKYRIYPNKQQIISLSKLFGCCRVVWNDALALCNLVKEEGGKKPTFPELSKIILTQAKKTEERKWLSEVSSTALQQSLKNLDQAFSNFFNSIKGKRKGRKVNPPKFKRLKSKQTANFTREGFRIRPNSKLYISKIGEIKTVWDRELPSAPSSITVIKESSGRYFVSFVVDADVPKLPPNNNSVGLDLGIIDFVTYNTGEKVKAPKPLQKRLKKLKKLQRKLSRTEKGSNRRKVARKKVAKLHAEIKDTRTDFLHKLSTKIIRENQTIVLEDLDVSGLLKNKYLAKSISDLGWYSFRTMLEAKAEMYGRDFRVIDRWTPTSQVCSECGFKGGKKELNVREWTCINCGTVHDRDINAAKNIVAVGHGETLNGRGGKCKTSSEATADESSIYDDFFSRNSS